MENAKVDFVSFDSADVIATSGNIRYGFAGDGMTLNRYSDKNVVAYNAMPYPVGPKKPDSRVDENDQLAYDFWAEVAAGTDTININGEEFSTEGWTNVSKWLFLNSRDNTWRLVDRSGQ